LVLTTVKNSVVVLWMELLNYISWRTQTQRKISTFEKLYGVKSAEIWSSRMRAFVVI
jgi:hypothetical protein